MIVLRKKNEIIAGLILLISLYIIETYKYEYFCFECINKNKINKCSLCKVNILFKDITIYDEEYTLNEIINKNKSISRFGDGEFDFMHGKSIFFQNYSKEMSLRMFDIINSREKNLLIGINLPYKKKMLNKFNKNTQNYYKTYLEKFKYKLAKTLKNKEYYSATITRYYIDVKNKKKVGKYVKKLKQIWNKRDIVIVEGEKSRLGIGNNLFDNANSIHRVICPATNAFNRYHDIINTINNKVDKNKLILIALGPTATVLSYDLYNLGYQSLDVGHIDIEYEWFLRKAKTKIPIKNKFVNEKRNCQSPFTNISDINYYNQIIATILD